MTETLSDTSAAAEEVQRAAWARLGPAPHLALRMSEQIRDVSIDGLMARCPELSRGQA